MKNGMNMKSRRGVGGLVSLIALVIVFGIASLAFLDINSNQTDLVNTSIKINKKMTEKHNESLNFTTTKPTDTSYQITARNLWSETTKITSYVVIKTDSKVSALGYLNNKIVKAGAQSTFTINDPKGTINDQNIILLTDNGKKCVLPVTVSWRLC
ncbi:MAG: hypothetical protein ACREAE_04290 [Nitrosopumilaceae archaeon]